MRCLGYWKLYGVLSLIHSTFVYQSLSRLIAAARNPLYVCDGYRRSRLLIADTLSILRASFGIFLTVYADQNDASLYPPTCSLAYT